MKEKELERIAEESLSSGENNLAIVLYAYLGASKAGMGGVYAKHCQNFAEIHFIARCEDYKMQRKEVYEKIKETTNGKRRITIG